MKSNYLLLYLFSMMLFGSSIIYAQKNVPFIEKWLLGQVNADEKANVYKIRYPEITHYKTSYKTFYDSISGQQVTLDMFIEVPKGKGPFPVVIFIHGGGFVAGNKSGFTSQSFAVAQIGIVGISIEYRLKGHGGTFFQFIEDTMDAVEFIRSHSADYQIDFTRLALAGGSAGGYLSSYAAMKTPECICYVGYNGMYDLDSRGTFKASPTRILNAISPVEMIKTPPPVTLLFHGKEDTTIPCQVSVDFASAIKAKGGAAEVLIYEDQKHGFFNKEPYLSTTTDALLKHLTKVLMP